MHWHDQSEWKNIQLSVDTHCVIWFTEPKEHLKQSLFVVGTHMYGRDGKDTCQFFVLVRSKGCAEEEVFKWNCNTSFKSLK
jgi:hypothetical protein